MIEKNIKKDVFIKITGVQIVDGEKDKTELFTQGRYYRKNGKYFIFYDESEATGYEGCKTTLKVEGQEKVIMTREGAMQSNLVVEIGKSNIGFYQTPQGDLQITVNAKEIKSNLDEHGGGFSFKYSLDINASHVSDNEVYINIKECK